MSNEVDPEKYTICCGNPADGLELYGLYDTAAEAAEAGNQDPLLPDEWWILPIHPMEAAT